MLAKKMSEARLQNRKEPVFTKIEFKRLQTIAMETISQNLHLNPHFIQLSQELQDEIISKVPSDLPIEVSCKVISQESYWKRSVMQRWPMDHIQIEDHGMSWKIAYFEKYFQDRIEQLKSFEDEDRSKLISELRMAHYWVFSLKITQLQIQLDMQILFIYLPLLTSIELCYGVKYSGMKYKKQDFGMKLSDAGNLGDSLKYCSNLLKLNLTGNQIDDDILRFIMVGLNLNTSLQELDLSHNLISDEGAKRISKYIMRNEIIQSLNLADNQLNLDGITYLGHALTINKTLKCLNIKINKLTDKCGARLFQDLVSNSVLETLDISSNNLGHNTALKLHEYLTTSSCKLRNLDLCANNFTDDSFETLKITFTKNKSLSKLDIRNCQFKKCNSIELIDIIIKHDLGRKKIPMVVKSIFDARKSKLLKEQDIKPIEVKQQQQQS